MQMIEDSKVKNKVCCSIVPIPNFDDKFLVARNRHGFNLINVKTGTQQPLIGDISSTAWYQESMLVLRSPNTTSVRILYCSKECHSTP